ncbi:hypothetical protein LMG27198_01270 [Methylocystis echinoides]|uniref:Uncharacterized protein n=2 Tax=Methylocystis echinoides TaxID=29468 RepID=A0A9W6GQP0_9HYPH|nr:hypothetical protein LMG27198_01270 [Methylocystis echinoides]
MPQRLPYLQAIASLRQADGLLLLGSDEPHYTASKIYSALMSERPYLSIYSSESSAHAILKQAGGGIALSFDNRYQLENMDSLVSNALYDLATKPEALGRANSLTYATYKAARIAERFAEIFERVTLSPRALVCGDV